MNESPFSVSIENIKTLDDLEALCDFWNDVSNQDKERFNDGLDEKLNNENNYNKIKVDSLFNANQNNDDNSSYSKKEKGFENTENEEKNLKNNKYGNIPQYEIFCTEKIDLIFNPQIINRKKIENQIVKENDLKIFNIGDKNISKFSTDKNKIEQFNVLIEPDKTNNNKEFDIKKVEKSDFENQTLEDEYLISKQNKNIFTIQSSPNKNNLSFNGIR